MKTWTLALGVMVVLGANPAGAEPRLRPTAAPSTTALYDQSEAYQLGAVPTQSTTVTFGQPENTAERVRDVVLNADPQDILGCDAVDPKKLTVNTLNDPQFVDEVVGDYPNTELFRRMAQLMLQSPSLVGAIQATVTAGSNRAKLKEDRCRTAEALADSRNIRLREEARRLCVQREAQSGDPTKCLGDNDSVTLKRYLEQVLQEPRWSKDFYTQVCQTTRSDEGTPHKGCFWVALLPNAKFNAATGESQVNQPVVSADRLFEAIEMSTTKILRERLDIVQNLLVQHGYAKVLADVASGYDSSPDALDNYTDMSRYIVLTHPVSACGSGGTRSVTRDGLTQSSQYSVVAADDFIAQMNSTDAQEMRVFNSGGLRSGAGAPSSTQPIDIDAAVRRLLQIAERGAACIAARDVHGHVDVRLSQLALGDQEAALRSLSQGIAAKTVKGILNGAIAKLEDVAGQRANAENSNSAISLSPDMARYLQAQIEVLKRRMVQIDQVTANFGDVGTRVSRINALYDQQVEKSLKESQAKFARVPAVTGQSQAAAMGEAQRR